MEDQWSFHYRVSKVPDGKAVTTDQAEQILLRQLEHRERDEEQVLWDLVNLYGRTGRQDVAFDYLRRLVEKAGTAEKEAGCYLAMGRLMEQIHDYPMAIRFYSEALAREPVDRETWYFINNNLGYCLNHSGRFATGERYCRTAIQIDPKRSNAHKNLAISLEGQGQFAKAALSYIAAIRANAADPRALRHLEALVDKHPDIADQVPNLQQYLAASRMAVEHVAQMKREAIKQFNAKLAATKGKDCWLGRAKRFFGRNRARMATMNA